MKYRKDLPLRSRKRKDKKKIRVLKQPENLRPTYFHDGVVQVVKVIDFSYENDCKLSLVGYWCRGFERRHWRKLSERMKSEGFDSDFCANIYKSWLSFKLLSHLRPNSRKDIVWIFKNFLDVESQKFYKKIRDFYFDTDYHFNPIELSMVPLYKAEGTWLRYKRLSNYFQKEESAYILPMSCFPLVDPNKSDKMPLCEVPLDFPPDLQKEFRELFTKYLVQLSLDDLYVPPADILSKVGNQKYNDGGNPRLDHELPQVSFNSSFLYQKFIAQPLTPREVWLPGKGIKINNSFWMVVCRQLLRKDSRYPDPDVRVTWENIKSRLDQALLRFDISGFGFQYPRILLEIGASVITELYPMSELDEQYQILTDIFKNITVQVGSSFVVPTRGIGLGYYEDLKTLIMLAILDKFDPISLYGDQGLLDLWQSGAISELQRYQFIVEFDKVEWVGSTKVPTVKWAGASMSSITLDTSRRFFDSLLGAFFSRFHWERKLNMRSISRSFSEYRGIQGDLFSLYKSYFGYEFYQGEIKNHFDNGGIGMYNYCSGFTKLYKVQRMVAPYDPLLFDLQYVTPFKATSRKLYPWRLAKDFSKKRKEVFKGTQLGNSMFYDYVHPRIRMANLQYKGEKIIPGWADLLYIAKYGRSSGSFTYNLSPPAIRDAYLRYPLSTLPSRAAATGGYRVLTRWAAPSVPCEEDLEECELLLELGKRSLVKVRRADLHQDPYFQEDPLYTDTDLINPHGEKRRSPPTLNSSLFDDEEARDIAIGVISRKMACGEINRPIDVVNFLPGLLIDIQSNSDVERSSLFGDELDYNHSDQEADDILAMM